MAQVHKVRLSGVESIFADSGMSRTSYDRLSRLIRKHGTHAKIIITVHDPIVEEDFGALDATLKRAESDDRLILSSWS